MSAAQPSYTPPPPTSVVARPRNGLGVASLVIGVASLVAADSFVLFLLGLGGGIPAVSRPTNRAVASPCHGRPNRREALDRGRGRRCPGSAGGALARCVASHAGIARHRGAEGRGWRDRLWGYHRAGEPCQ